MDQHMWCSLYKRHQRYIARQALHLTSDKVVVKDLQNFLAHRVAISPSSEEVNYNSHPILNCIEITMWTLCVFVCERYCSSYIVNISSILIALSWGTFSWNSLAYRSRIHLALGHSLLCHLSIAGSVYIICTSNENTANSSSRACTHSQSSCGCVKEWELWYYAWHN